MAAQPSLPTAEEIRALVGHQFPGGDYTIAHWENFLLTECTGAQPLPDGLAHPVALFHMPILGAGTSIAEMFALGRAESDFSIGIESYDWEIHEPLREEVRYRVTGRITEADRRILETFASQAAKASATSQVGRRRAAAIQPATKRGTRSIALRIRRGTVSSPAR